MEMITPIKSAATIMGSEHLRMSMIASCITPATKAVDIAFPPFPT
jgi:Cu/Ag efflux protein CusF